MLKTSKSAFKQEKAALNRRLGIHGKRDGYKGRRYHKAHGGLSLSEHTGKLEDIHSLSTSCKVNSNCLRKMKIPGSICEKCFSDKIQDYRSGLEQSLKRNYDILTSHLLSDEELPMLNDIFSRIESFGDLEQGEKGIIQARNYIRYINKNFRTTFAWWTKNPHIVRKALIAEGYDADNGYKPENCILVFSSLFINKEVGIKAIKKCYPFIDKEFVVYSSEYILEHKDVEDRINCGSRQCLACLACYTHNNIETINEILK